MGVLLCAGIPFFFFGTETAAGLIGGTLFLVVGIGIILATCLSDHDFEYKALKQNPLLFDHNFWEELKNRYSNLRKKYISMIVGVVIVLLLGGVIFMYLRKFIVLLKVQQFLYFTFCCIRDWNTRLFFFCDGCL